MEKLSHSLRILLGILFLVGCSGAPTPGQAAQGYLKALESLDFEGASRYVSNEGRQSFDLLRKLYTELGKEEQRKFQVTNWAVTDVTVTGDSATVDFTFDKVKKGQLSLRRYGEVWKVEQRRTF